MTAKQVKEARREAANREQRAEHDKARDPKREGEKGKPHATDDIGGVVRPPADS